MQKRRNFIANALELHLFFIKPSIWWNIPNLRYYHQIRKESGGQKWNQNISHYTIRSTILITNLLI